MTDYIKKLRSKIGRETVLQCGASVIVIDGNGRLLLQKRRDNGMWGYHGGGVEPDERVEDAARRELYEETGLTALELELFGVFSGPAQHYIYPNGDDVSNIDIVYLCRSFSGELKAQPEEVAALRFFEPDALPLPEDISPPQREALQKYAALFIKRK